MKFMTFKGKLTFVLSVVVTATFLIIGISFNVIINEAILDNARDAIMDSRNIISSSDRGNQRIFVSTQNFVMSPSYQTIHTNMVHSPQMMMFHGVMARALESNGIMPSLIIHEMRISGELYYVNIIENPNNENQWIVLYVSMSTLSNLKSSLNLILFLIMTFMLIVSMLVIYFVSSSMTLPLTQLAAFATSVGQGQRQADHHEFHEQELLDLQKAMNTMVHNLDEQEQANRHFFQNVSHELRTPLQVILAQSEAFQYDFASKEQTLEVISGQGERLKSLIEDLLVLSRLEAHSVDMMVQKLDVRDLIEEISSSMNVLLQERNLIMEYHFPSLDSSINIDESSLHKVFTNLLSNAIRYAKTKIVWDVIHHHNELEVRISNDGEMIEDEFKDIIFNRFQKGEKGHIGIGLAIVKAVMEHYGGSIRVESNPSQTSFILMFKK
ncbi:MAG: HAMP domain-containing histidine kinase [Erysipelotrichia bacterium]|jgi:signal transduction histidine kinase|nr:HAMP domain-containing histidine kinase [Erysipelotrichia bacterium]